MNITQTFGSLIRDERLCRGLSQEQLAELANLHRNAIGLIERGERSPSIETVYAIAKGLKVSASSLLAKLEENSTDTQ